MRELEEQLCGLRNSVRQKTESLEKEHHFTATRGAAAEQQQIGVESTHHGSAHASHQRSSKSEACNESPAPAEGSMSQSAQLKGVAEEDAGGLEQEHVHDVYRTIASHFSSTRYKPW